MLSLLYNLVTLNFKVCHQHPLLAPLTPPLINAHTHHANCYHPQTLSTTTTTVERRAPPPSFTALSKAIMNNSQQAHTNITTQSTNEVGTFSIRVYRLIEFGFKKSKSWRSYLSLCKRLDFRFCTYFLYVIHLSSSLSFFFIYFFAY